MKEYFSQSIKLVQQYVLIENNYKIISNGFLHDTDLLTFENIYEKLSI